MKRLWWIALLFLVPRAHAQGTQVASYPSDPLTCNSARGIIEYNTTSQTLKLCGPSVNTWSVISSAAGTINGSATAGQVAYGSGANTLTSSPNLTYTSSSGPATLAMTCNPNTVLNSCDLATLVGTITGSVAGTATAGDNEAQITINSPNITPDEYIGLYGIFGGLGSGTFSAAGGQIGVDGNAVANGSTVVSKLIAVYGSSSSFSSGLVTNLVGVEAGNQARGGPVTTAIGIYSLDNSNIGATNYDYFADAAGVTRPATQYGAGEGAAPTGVAAVDELYANSTTHRWSMNNNNGGALSVVGITTAGTSGNIPKFAANGIDLLDSGAAYSNTTTGSATTPNLNLTPTWNTTGVVDAGIKLNVTDTASGAGSLLLDLQDSSTSRFTFDKAGTAKFTASTSSTVPLTLIPASTPTANILQIQNSTPVTTSGFGPTGGVFTGANDGTAYSFLAKSFINSFNDVSDPDDVFSLVGSANEVNLGFFLTAIVNRPAVLQMLKVGTNGAQFNMFVKPDGGSIFNATHVLPVPPYFVVDSPTNDATVYDTTATQEISGNQNDALNLVGGTITNATNLNFYLRAQTARRGAIQANNIGTNGGGVSIYSKADGGGLVQVNAWNATLETKFTPTLAAGSQSVSGCSLSANLGGGWAGSFHSGTAGTCTVTITPGGTATNGWQCDATDITTAADTVKQTTPLSTTTCVISGTTASGDIITWKATAF